MGENLKAAIDIGNTRIKCGVFKDRQLMDVLVSEDEHDLYSFLQDKKISSVIISDVSGDEKTHDYLKESITVIQMGHTLKLPIQNNYKSPKTLGTDRIAAAVGAQLLYNNQTIFIVDAGTCISTGFVQNNIYKGGSISPGIQMRYKALHDYTGKLPLVENLPVENIKPIGLDTENSIHSGVLAGAVYEIQSRIIAIRETEKITESLTIVTTGGDGAFLAEQLKYSNFANPSELVFEPNLVLIGLNEILLLNESETT